MKMKYYMAPMEGLTGYIYRNAYHACYHPMDKYFTPFLSPKANSSLSFRELNDILPEHNQGMYVVPQILTNQAEDFIRTAKELQEYGYSEINLNLGCPSGTVVAKGKGAGFLAHPRLLETFFDEIFSALPVSGEMEDGIRISVKTRLGMEDAEEFLELMELYGHYPFHELIIHPRVREDYYENRPDWDAFERALTNAPFPVVYNGDLFTVEDVLRFQERFPQVDTVMLGRGAVADPSLIRQLKGGEALSGRELGEFLARLAADYGEVFSGERDVLFKLKELWFYLGRLFPGGEAELKKIRKAQKLPEYQTAVRNLLRMLERRNEKCGQL